MTTSEKGIVFNMGFICKLPFYFMLLKKFLVGSIYCSKMQAIGVLFLLENTSMEYIFGTPTFMMQFNIFLEVKVAWNCELQKGF